MNTITVSNIAEYVSYDTSSCAAVNDRLVILYRRAVMAGIIASGEHIHILGDVDDVLNRDNWQEFVVKKEMNTASFLCTPFAIPDTTYYSEELPVAGINVYSGDQAVTLEMYYTFETGYWLEVTPQNTAHYHTETIYLVSNPELFEIFDPSQDIFIVEELPRFAAFLSQAFMELETENQIERAARFPDIEDIPY